MQKYLHLLRKAESQQQPYLLLLNEFKDELSALREEFHELFFDSEDKARVTLNQAYEQLRLDARVTLLVNKIKNYVAGIIGADVAQKDFSVRYVPKGVRSVEYHIDKWSGHPERICNVWIPLSLVNNQNCLRALTIHDSRVALDYLEATYDIDAFENRASSLSKPLVFSDRVLCFGNEFVHGADINRASRLSIDFRLSWFSELKSGTKKLGDDYVLIEDWGSQFSLGKHPQEFHLLVYQQFDAVFASHQFQRKVVLDFADRFDLSICLEGSEYHGFSFYPQLTRWLSDPTKQVIVFSKNVFMQNGELSERVRYLSTCYPGRVYCVLENEWL